MEVYNKESPTSATNATKQTENNRTPVQIDNSAGIGGNMQSIARICGMRPQQPLKPAVTMSMLDGGASKMMTQLQEMQNHLQQQMELFSRMIVVQSENWPHTIKDKVLHNFWRKLQMPLQYG